MRHCSYCGTEIQNDMDFCPSCGTKIEKFSQNNQNTNITSSDDTGSSLYCLLGACMPMAGLILYLVWNKDKPKNAKQSLTGFLISLGLYVLMIIIYVIIFVIALSTYAA